MSDNLGECLTAPGSREPDQQAVPALTGFDPSRIAEVLADGDGFWRTCSGCYETEDGYDVGHYPHSELFGCKMGGGCGDCGGLGIVWDNIDYDDMARWSQEHDAETDRVRLQLSGLAELLALIGAGHWTSSVFHCPPMSGKPRGWGASLIRVGSDFKSERAAMAAAEQAVASGWVGTIMLHKATAKAGTGFSLNNTAITEIGRLAQAIDARSGETGTGSIGEADESAVPQECAQEDL